MSEWIACSERMPKESDLQTYVLDTVSGLISHPCCLWLRSDGRVVVHFRPPLGFPKTNHWAPLPAPPTEQGGK